MPLDPQAQVVLDQLAAMDLPPAHTVSPEEARINLNARPRSPGPEMAKVEDRLIPGDGPDIPVRIYTPHGSGPFPGMVWFHGGGWVVGNLDTADGTARHVAAGAGCVVVSVGYRLAPEDKFPAAADDSYAATRWVAENAASIDVDPARIAVGGDSAGGNLAAVVSLMARDRGGPPLVFQLMVYPATERNFETESCRENADGYLLTTDSMKWFWGHYLKSEEDAVNPYAAPMARRRLVRTASGFDYYGGVRPPAGRGGGLRAAIAGGGRSGHQQPVRRHDSRILQHVPGHR